MEELVTGGCIILMKWYNLMNSGPPKLMKGGDVDIRPFLPLSQQQIFYSHDSDLMRKGFSVLF